MIFVNVLITEDNKEENLAATIIAAGFATV